MDNEHFGRVGLVIGSKGSGGVVQENRIVVDSGLKT
jgi:hypothetical protein